MKTINLTLRLLPDLHKKLKEMAQAQNRSLSQQIIHILTEYIKKNK